MTQSNLSTTRVAFTKDEWGLHGSDDECERFATVLNTRFSQLLENNLSREAVLDDMFRLLSEGQPLGAYEIRARSLVHQRVIEFYGNPTVYTDQGSVYNDSVHGE